MNLTDQLFKKVENLAAGVRNDFRKKGIVLPITDNRGIVHLDNFSIIKTKNGSYSILNSIGDPVVENINLPQTAILVANKLALGKYVDDKLISLDKKYGYNIFEHAQFDKVAKAMQKKQDWDRMDTLIIKSNDAKLKAESARKSIIMSFEKLRLLR